jgi:O-antigen ligase
MNDPRARFMSQPMRILAFLVLFVGGYNFALPVVDESAGVPLIFRPIQVAHGVFARDALLMLYLAIAIVSGSLGRIRLNRNEKRFAQLIAGLGVAGILSTVVNLASLYDIGEAFRLLLLAAYFCMAEYWASTLGTAAILRTFLVGIAVGGAINLFYTFQIQFMTIGILPFLLGQNGPGGYLALAVSLGAWLMLIQKRRADAVVAVAVALVGGFAASISYSRLAMLMALCGLIAWSAVIVSTSAIRRSRRLGFGLLAFVLIILLGVSSTSLGQEYTSSVNRFVNNKFAVIDVENQDLTARYNYFWGVLEIFAEHPITGVSYSGFYSAITVTSAYHSGSIGEELGGPNQKGANPHNSFLYYIAANGLVGLVLVSMLFVSFLRVLRRSFRPYGTPGLVIWSCFALAYFVNAMTLPTVYSTEILYLPAALAFAELRHRIKPAIVGTGALPLSRVAS